MKLSAGSCIGRRFPGQSTDRKRGNADGGGRSPAQRRNGGERGSPERTFFIKTLDGKAAKRYAALRAFELRSSFPLQRKGKRQQNPLCSVPTFFENVCFPCIGKDTEETGGGKRLARCASFASSQHRTFTRFCIENIDAPTRLPERFARAFLRSRRAEPCPELSFIQRPAAWRSRRACNGSIWRLLLFAGVEARRTSEDYEEAALPCSLYVVLASQKSRRDRRLNCRKRS